jgi:hypothetical protein
MDPATMSEAELKIKNDKMIEIAAENNIDISPYVGQYMDLIADRIQYDSVVESQQAQAISDKYIAMSPSARNAYKQTPEGKQFSTELMEIDRAINDAERSQLLLDQAKDTGDYKSYAPQLFKSIQDRLDNLEEGPAKAALEAEFKAFKDSNPDFTAGNTLTSVTSAKRIVNSLEVFNNRITTTVVEDLTNDRRSQAKKDEIKNALIKTTLNVSNAEVERFIENGSAKDALEESGAEKEGSNVFGKSIYSEEQIANKAREMAVQDRRDMVEQNYPELFDQYVVGQTYTDANGNKAVYKGNGQWEEVEQGES